MILKNLNLLSKTIIIFLIISSLNSCLKIEINTSNKLYQKNNLIASYVQKATYYYQNPNDYTDALKEDSLNPSNIKNSMDLIKYYMKSAYDLDNTRLELAYSLASGHIFLEEVEEALVIYETILKQHKKELNSIIYSIFYNHSMGRQSSVDLFFKKLKRFNKETYKLWLNRFNKVNDLSKKELKLYIKRDDAISDSQHAIIVMGYSLEKNGSIGSILKDRLQKTLDLSYSYPDSKIIVSGGLPKQGETQAKVMKNWLVEKGVSEDKIIMENRGIDTVSSAIHSLKLLKSFDTTNDINTVTIVSSASHMRRCLGVFNAVSEKDNLNLKFDNLVALDYSSMDELNSISPSESLHINKDVLRAYGLSPFPALTLF